MKIEPSTPALEPRPNATAFSGRGGRPDKKKNTSSARAGLSGAEQAAGHGGASAPRPAALTIRRAQAGDAEPLGFFFDTALRKDYFLRRGQLAEILAGKHHQAYVAEIDAVLVGIAITTRGSRLVNALVHPAYRGLGIGRALIEASGATEVRAKIDMSSGDPRRFYQSLGFAATGQFNGKGNIEVMRRAASVINGKRQRQGKRICAESHFANGKAEKSDAKAASGNDKHS